MPITRPRPDRPATPLVFDFLATPGIPAVAESYARQKIDRLTHLAPRPILHARVKLARFPAGGRRCVAQATLDIDGRLVRAHVDAGDSLEAIDLLQEGLQAQITRLDTARSAARRRVRGPRPSVAVTADDEDATPVVRRRSLSPGPSTVEEAIFDLEMLDADFLLYEDVATGDHAVVHHRPDARIGLVRYGPHAGHAHDQLPADVVVEPGPPTLTPADAVERLRAGGEPFVAVVDATTGRAVVAYRRWDGRLGVVTPADEPISPAEPRAARRRLRRELDRLEGVRSTIWAEGIDAMTEAEDIAELSAVDQHPADLGTETFERERDLSLLQEVDAEIDAVRRALARIPLGTYGTCEACGEPIPDERLRAVPATRLCLDDQLRAEADSGLHDGRP